MIGERLTDFLKLANRYLDTFKFGRLQLTLYSGVGRAFGRE